MDTTPWDLVAETPVRYSPETAQVLINGMLWSKIPQTARICGVKTEKSNVWNILTILKKVLGQERFNTTVGLMNWDICLLMVYTVALTDTELQESLIIAKQILSEQGITPGQALHEQKIRSVLYDVYQLHPKARILADGHDKLPEWDDIGPEMDIQQWL